MKAHRLRNQSSEIVRNFIENTTVSEIAEYDSLGCYFIYDECDFPNVTVHLIFVKRIQKTLLLYNVSNSRRTILKNNSTLIGWPKMFSAPQEIVLLMLKRKRQFYLENY